MSSPGTRPVVHTEDAQRADDVIAAWKQERYGPGDLRRLRGLLLAAFADHRTDAYNDGYNDHAAGIGL